MSGAHRTSEGDVRRLEWAVIGTLDWFMGGIRTADPSLALTTHRWLDTSTDMLAVLTLLVGEASWRPGRQKALRWFAMLFLCRANGARGGLLRGGRSSTASGIMAGPDRSAWRN